MTLALIVYLIGLTTTLQVVAGLLIFIGLLAIFVIIMNNSDRRSITGYQDREKYPIMKYKGWVFAVVISTCLLIITPTEKTAYMMLGAYATQEIAEAVVENEEVKNIGHNILKIINDKIEEYAEKGEK